MTRTDTEIKAAVRQKYSDVATGGRSCCSGPAAACDSPSGYTTAERASLPAGADLGLGCGRPTRLVPLEPGMTVLDLGSGAGVDVFLAAQQVGPQGRVIGVDMTDAMLEKARRNAAAGGYANVEFRRGEIEDLPVDSGSVDVILSNCVINLAPDKSRVFREAYRVLRSGGRLQISDIVTRRPLPAAVRGSLEQWAGCVAGALPREDYLQMIRQAGFSEVRVADEFAPSAAAGEILSISVVAEK